MIKKTKDAKQGLKFEIKENTSGTQCDSNFCMIAEAIAGAGVVGPGRKKVVHAQISGTVGYLTYEDGTVLRYTVPSKLSRAIKKFDDSKDRTCSAESRFFKVAPPGIYELRAPKGNKTKKAMRAIAAQRTADGDTRHANRDSGGTVIPRKIRKVSARTKFARARRVSV